MKMLGRTRLKKFMATLLAIVVVASIIPGSVSAAVNWPSYSSSKPIKAYTISTGNNTTVYSTSAGAANSTSSQRYGTIYATDECQILSTTTSNGVYVAKVRYPVSNGTKTGYVKLSVFTSAKAPSSKKTSNGSITVYRRASTSSKLGTIYKNDTVWIMATSGNYTQVIYNVGSASSPTLYKMGWIKTSDYTKYINTETKTSGSSMSNALYKLDGDKSYITCDFDGYSTTPGHHEGIDFSYKSGAEVYSLSSGVVKRVVAGKTGSTSKGGQLSTIAIYYEAANKTVIYLHVNPLSSLSVGDKIAKGQKIGTESNRGAGSSHTHVEVRDGVQMYAAVSVNDSTLDNSDPTSFWNSLGYTVY